MSELKFIQKIFSIKNTSTHKVIRLIGFSFNINRKKLFNLRYKHLNVEDKIVFSNFAGNGYGCNPKYIAEEILKRKLPYKLVWLVNKPKEEHNIPDGIKVVNANSARALKELATAKLWVSNVRLIKFFRKGLVKRKNQMYIQTWHGSLGIKKIDGDTNSKFTENLGWDGLEEIDSKSTDILISNSIFESNVYKSAFWGRGEIKLLGHPRNDIMFTDYRPVKEKIYKYYNIDNDYHTFIYVPSFRDNGKIYPICVEYEEIKKALEQKFGGKWKIFVRLHPHNAKYQDIIIPDEDYIINTTEYPDIQELLVASDIAMTDYSSCIFDFMLTRKPAFIYASDLKYYDETRGFYYPITSTPFPVATNNEQLKQNILDFHYDSYKKKLEKFLSDKGCMEDGNASQRVVDLINQYMGWYKPHSD